MSNLLEQASLVMIPSGYKEDIVYSVIPTSGAGDLTFTRASNGTRIDSNGNVEVVPWNLLQQSQNFLDNVNWGKADLTINSNNTTAPNGTITADKLTLDATTSAHVFYQSIPNQNSGYYTVSIYAKYGNTRYLGMRNQTGGVVNGYQFFDILNGVVASSTGTTYGASIENVGNGWYRCSLICLSTNNTDVQYVAYSLTTVDGDESCTSNGSLYGYLWGAQANIGSTAKPYFPTTDRLNVPRLTYQNGGGGCPSLLLEKQSTNLQLWSEDLTNAVYISGGGGGSSITRTANYAISPDGTQNADRLQFVRGSSGVELYQRVAVTIGTTYTFSFWAKSLSGTPTLYTTWNGAYANEVTFTTDWVRYTYTFVAADTTAGFNFVTYTGAPSTSTTADLLVWGVQLEASSYTTSYIPTTSSSATRVADACYKTGASSLIGQTEGVIFMDAKIIGAPTDGSFFGVQKSASNFVIRFGYNNLGFFAQVFNGSGNLFFETISYTLGTRIKIALAYKASNYAVYANGIQMATGTNATSIPACDEVMTNSLWGSANPSLYEINEAILFPTRLTNSELAQLTGNQNYTINQAYASYGVASESPNCVQP